MYSGDIIVGVLVDKIVRVVSHFMDIIAMLHKY